MTILVAGGTGLVGPRLLKRFVAADVDCRALVRSGQEVPAGVTAVEGDILSPDPLPAAVEGISAIVHLAALFRTPDEDQIWQVKRRFLMASTSNAYHPDSTSKHSPRRPRA